MHAQQGKRACINNDVRCKGPRYKASLELCPVHSVFVDLLVFAPNICCRVTPSVAVVVCSGTGDKASISKVTQGSAGVMDSVHISRAGDITFGHDASA